MALDRVKRNSCRASSAVFENRVLIKRQVNVTERKKPRLKCKMCSSFFVKEKTLSTHMMKFHFLLKCPECDEYFNQKAGLRLHLNNHHPVKSDPKNVPADKDLCQFCGINVGKRGSMVVHLTEVHDGLKCASCDKWCKGGIGLNTHLKRCKSSQRSDAYKCHICKKSFVKCASLVSHIKTCFKKNYKNGQLIKQPDGCECKICGKEFVSTSSLAGHLTHCMKSYKCSICSKGYSMQSELDRHIRIFHTGEKPYRCKKCGKRFPHSKLLRVHIEVVHKQNNLNSLTGAKKKMHKCIVCRKVFTQQSYLKMHMKIHTYEKRLKCGICGEKFSNEKTIIEHINIFHVPGGCKGDTRDMEYIVECVDSWNQQGFQQDSHENHSNPKHENGSMAIGVFPAASPQPTEDHLQIEGQDELTLNLTPSSSHSTNSDYSSFVLSSKPDTNQQNYLNNEAVSLSEGPLVDQHLPQLIDTIVAKDTSSQDTLLQAILADIPQNNPSSVSNHLNFIKGTCEKAIIDVTQNLSTSLPSPLPCTRQKTLEGTKMDVGGEQDSSLLLSLPYPDSGQQSDPASAASVGVAAEIDSSLTISIDDAEEEDYYVTVNEYSDEENGEDESDGGQITDKKKLENSQHSLEKNEGDVMDMNGDCSTVPEIQGYSLRDQPYITEDELHGINGENFIKMALNCEWKSKQTQPDTNSTKHEQNQHIPLQQKKDMSVSHCNNSDPCICSKERFVHHICGICQQGFQSVQELQQHKISSHSLKCAQCEQQYSKMMDLLNHYESCNCSRNGR